MMRISLLFVAILLAGAVGAQVGYNANQRVNPYNTEFLYGVNVGIYNTWDDRTKADIAAGNPALNIKGAGVKTYHAPLPETFLETWGYGIRVNEFNHYASLGMKDHTIFLEGPTAAHKDNNKYGGCADESLLFKNLYEPIWDGGANGTPVNENNYYALYVYKTVSTYKAYTKFWEVINEPDMGPKAFDPVGTPGNWWENAPSPCDLSHIKAPIYQYIRMLRITYEVVKTLDPSAYVGPGGVGSGSFLDALMRYTDNPVDGSVTAAYPAKGGAYFDALSFHFYPMYSLKFWQNGNFAFKRHSDAAITEYINHKNYLNNIVTARGYDGITYPKKVVICTENGMPRKAFGEYVGSDETQKNYIIKSVIESQKNDVRQYYTFILGDGTDEWNAKWEFDVMGFYLNLNNNGPINGPGYKQQYSNAGKAHKTTSDLLLGFRYDATRTTLMNLPANIGGAAFYNGIEYRYVLWAKTTTDLSELASATYSFPAAANVPAGLKRREWNFMETGATTDVSAQNISLNSTPSFFLEGGTVNPAPPPVAAAGADVTITLPVSSVNLDGSTSAAPGSTITKFNWTYLSGPAGYTIASPTAASTAVSGLVQGVYNFRLSVTNSLGTTATDDIQVTVNAATPAQVPVANAGKDESIPVGQATVLHGETSTAAAGIKSYSWAKISGPAPFEMLTPAANSTWIRNMTAGVYTFRLTITDNNGATASDDVVITVGSGNPPTNQTPIAKAGNDVTITLPINSVTLSNAGSSDPDGNITAYKWSFVSGPATYLLATPNSAGTLVTGLAAGVYVFRLTVTDNAGATATDDVTVFVNAAPLPGSLTANAGKDEAIPVGQATVLHGENSTAIAGIKSYAWTKVSGPTQYELLSPAANSTWIRNMVSGVYTFRLTITDNLGATAFDDVIITVGTGSIPPNQLPVARAGNDLTITLPVNSVTLANAGSSDADGSITAYQWTFISGPGGYNIATPNAASSIINNLVAGTYVFRLTVTDNAGATAYDEVVVMVNSAPLPGNIVANAGKDESIPVGQATVLHGETSTAAAGIKSYSWTKLSGPATYEMLTPTGSSTWVRNMIAGTYVFRLTITDNNGSSAYDDVVITVGSATINAIVANAGKDETIPVGQATVLHGETSSAIAGIKSYSWVRYAGPTQYELLSPSAASTWIRNMVAGVYVYRLTVTDNLGATAVDDVTVTVAPNTSAISGVNGLPNEQAVVTLKGQSVLVYPNPVINTVNIKWTGSYIGAATVHFVDASGVIIRRVNVNKQQTLFTQDMDVTGLKQGIYMIHIRMADGQTVIQKMFKK